jgi:hypothetical protein
MQDEDTKYPAAEIILQHSHESYRDEWENYYHIYDRVNIALTFCSVLLLVFIDAVDMKTLLDMKSIVSSFGSFVGWTASLLQLTSAFMLVRVTNGMVKLMKGKKIDIVDLPVYIRDEQYKRSTDEVTERLLVGYAYGIKAVRREAKKKQKEYNALLKRTKSSIYLFFVAKAIISLGV